MRALIAPILAVALVLALTVPTALASHQSLRPSPAGVRALADPAVVTISGAGATPQVLTVDAGTAVQWLNHDSITHTITADDGSFGPYGSTSTTRALLSLYRPARTTIT